MFCLHVYLVHLQLVPKEVVSLQVDAENRTQALGNNNKLAIFLKQLPAKGMVLPRVVIPINNQDNPLPTCLQTKLI